MSKVIMIVDDSITVRVAVKATLTKEGYEVQEGSNGKDALQKLESLSKSGKRVNLIISDVNMPQMDGITFITELRKNMAYKFTPILVLTTESQESMKLKGKQAGATGWLVKPFQPTQLVEIIKKLIR
ncbi:MAG TPA: response regulator [Thermotogota bacterium]|nr:response regulator [Thermotogota bacterium]HRW91456.1 response regulator [Thermotogota bacterium]